MVEIQSIEGGVKFIFTDNTFYLQNGTIQYPLNSLAMIIDESNAVTFRLPNNDIALSVKLSELGKTKDEMEALYAEAFVGDSGMAPEDVEELIDERVTPIEEELDALDGVVTAHTADTQIHVTAQDKQNWNAKASQADIENLQQQIDTKEETISAALNDLNDGLDVLEEHSSNRSIHVSAQEKAMWNSKADASDIADIETELATKADQSDLDSLATQLEGKADATDVESQMEVAAIAMTKLDEEKADKEDTYTKSETDTALANKANTATTYTKSEVDTLIQSLEQAIAAQLGGLSFVELTQAEYDALTTKAQHTVYIING